MPDIRDNYISFNGKSSADYDIIVSKNPSPVRAKRKFEKVTVPGRNGDVYFMEDAWENYTQQYTLFVGDGSENSVPTAVAKVAEWLDDDYQPVTIDDYINLTINGYKRLIDSYEEDVIRLATFTNGYEPENIRGWFGKLRIGFNCRPERFTTDAFTVITKTTSGGYITNPTGQRAKPCIKVYGSGSGSITVNGYQVNIAQLNQYLHIDSELQDAYRGLNDPNQNIYVTLVSDFPVLDVGNNYITWNGGITQVDIYPRWWNL